MIASQFYSTIQYLEYNSDSTTSIEIRGEFGEIFGKTIRFADAMRKIVQLCWGGNTNWGLEANFVRP
jgi:hypothetical protein